MLSRVVNHFALFPFFLVKGVIPLSCFHPFKTALTTDCPESAFQALSAIFTLLSNQKFTCSWLCSPVILALLYEQNHGFTALLYTQN